MNKIFFLIAFCLLHFLTYSQEVNYNNTNRDKGIFIEQKPGYYQNSILKDIRNVAEKKEPPKVNKRFKLNVESREFPNKKSLYKSYWHNAPVSQGNTGTCWCYSTTSFFESEIYRQTGQKVKLSEMYTVYWEYVAKARRFVRERGNSLFDEGSEANAVVRIWKEHGIVPYEAYTGLKEGQLHHNHEPMVKEMKTYLKYVKEANLWDEEQVVSTIKSILNYYIGEPPSKVKIDNKLITPQEYLKNILKLNMDDYIDVMSLMQQPYWEKVIYDVPDNWWKNTDYYNVPLNVFMQIIKNSIRKGYTLAIGGDVSEAGFETSLQIAIIPTFDIPTEYIDDDARQFRFSNNTTTDDHGMHLVGYTEINGVDWYLIKDSSSGSRNNDENAPEFGYYFFREDYVKLKMMTILVHKDMVQDIIKQHK
ncbi:MAG TPA: C1 family peptidase [Bacteroidales bacterium]|nr:C1 family peptidase [Bacteroidales bacterium]